MYRQRTDNVQRTSWQAGCITPSGAEEEMRTVPRGEIDGLTHGSADFAKLIAVHPVSCELLDDYGTVQCDLRRGPMPVSSAKGSIRNQVDSRRCLIRSEVGNRASPPGEDLVQAEGWPRSGRGSRTCRMSAAGLAMGRPNQCARANALVVQNELGIPRRQRRQRRRLAEWIIRRAYFGRR